MFMLLVVLLSVCYEFHASSPKPTPKRIGWVNIETIKNMAMGKLPEKLVKPLKGFPVQPTIIEIK